MVSLDMVKADERGARWVPQQEKKKAPDGDSSRDGRGG